MERVIGDVPEEELTGGRVYVTGLPGDILSPDTGRRPYSEIEPLNDLDYVGIHIIGGGVLGGVVVGCPLAAIVSVFNSELGSKCLVPIMLVTSYLGALYANRQERNVMREIREIRMRKNNLPT